MKNKSFFYYITLCVSVVSFFSCGSNSVGTISLDELVKKLDDPSCVIIDTRDDEFYNGFCEEGAKRGGHIKGAIQFPASWLDYIEDDKFESFAAGKGITRQHTLVVYGSSSDSINKVALEFARARLFSAYLFAPSRLHRLRASFASLQKLFNQRVS